MNSVLSNSFFHPNPNSTHKEVIKLRTVHWILWNPSKNLQDFDKIISGPK